MPFSEAGFSVDRGIGCFADGLFHVVERVPMSNPPQPYEYTRFVFHAVLKNENTAKLVVNILQHLMHICEK